MRLFSRATRRRLLLVAGMSGMVLAPALALEKEGMPDLCQVDQTCLPTSTANLVLWFGRHGYPKLIQSGATEADREAHTVHVLMADTGARFDLGTPMDTVSKGIKKYIQDAGYSGSVEYRGLGTTPFTDTWLKENDDPNKGFVLFLLYTKFDRAADTFTNAWNIGHAVTLVNAAPDMLLVHDPAHEEDQTGRKILTPQVLTGGFLVAEKEQVPVAGLMLLSGSLLDAPADSSVMCIGAVCISMHPDKPPEVRALVDGAKGPNTMVAGTPTTPAPGAAPAKPTASSWITVLWDLFFQ